MSDIALVHISTHDLAAGERLCFLDNLREGVAVIGIAGQRLGMEDELAAFAAFVGGGQRDLDAELVRRPRLATSICFWADAFGLGRVP